MQAQVFNKILKLNSESLFNPEQLTFNLQHYAKL